MKKQIIIVKTDLQQFPDEATRNEIVTKMSNLVRTEIERQGIGILICDKSQVDDILVLDVDV